MANETETPQTTPAPTTAPAAPAAAAAPAVSTTVKIGERTFELKQMSVEAGLELYKALPATYQTQADQIAQVLTMFASIQKIASKEGIDPTELARDWIATINESDTAKAMRTAMSDAKKRALKELDANRKNIDVGALVKMVPGGEAAMSAAQVANGVGTVVGTAAGVAGVAYDSALNGPKRIWNLAGTLGTEAWGKIFGYGDGAPSDNAKAFAAATMGLRYQAIEARHAKPLFNMPFDGVESQSEANPVQYAKAGGSWIMDWVRQNVPFVDFIIAAYRFVVNAGWRDDTPSFNAHLTQVRKDLAQERTQTPANTAHYQRLADTAMWDREGEAVEKSLLAAVEIAGIKSEKGAAKVATTDATVRGTDGVDRKIEKGKPVAQVTPGQRIQHDWNQLAGDTNPALGALAVGVAGASTVSGVHNAAKGVMQGLTAKVVNPSVATAKVMDWAAKPAQFGFAEATVKGVWGRVLNPIGTISNMGGWLTGHVVRIGANIGIGAVGAGKDFVVGAVKGAGELVNKPATSTALTTGAHQTAQVASTAAKIGSGAAKIAVRGAAVAAPVVSVGQTFEAVGAEEYGTAGVRLAETGAIAVAAKTAGVGILKGFVRRVPVIGAVVSGADGVVAAKDGNMGGVARAGVELGAMGVGAAIGSVVPVLGTGVGALVGGLVGWVGGKYFIEDTKPEKKPETPKVTPKASDTRANTPAAPVVPDLHSGLSAAAIEATRKAEAARVAANSTDAIERLRMATASGRTGANSPKIDFFSLGVAKADVKIGNVISPQPTPVSEMLASSSPSLTPSA